MAYRYQYQHLALQICHYKKIYIFAGEGNLGIYNAYDVRVDDTFVMVGGGLPTDEYPFIRDTLIEYSPQSGTFTEFPNKMKLPRHSATAILVDRSIFPSCA